jgi:deoxyribodipyrimidine photo-lyase
MFHQRVTVASGDAPTRPDGDYVLYWMIAARRSRWNLGLQHAVAKARALGKPLLVFEPLRLGYRWASRRMHTFVVQGMVDNAAAFGAAGVSYLPYVESEPGEGSGLLNHLAARACLVVTDDYPAFFLRDMVRAAAPRLGVRVEVVDGNGVLPLRQHERAFPVAHAFRRHLHRSVLLLAERPEAEPLAGYDLGRATLPALAPRWAAADLPSLLAGGLARLAIDDLAAAPMRGGATAADTTLRGFLARRLSRYHEDRSHPDDDASSGLSPWLHFGHLSAHEVAWAVLDGEGWTPGRVNAAAVGNRAGFWGLSAPAESFLDELLTWRELGHGYCHWAPDYAEFGTLPDWALATLAKHAPDRRPVVYDLATLDEARTGDPVWNAAQRQLRVEGRMHNYLRMLWGKKVLEWSPTPADAWERLIHLNNRYAVDGRDPNSYSGIAWTFGRFDRAWGPERPIYGTVRYMTSDNTVRKLRMKSWLARWGAGGLFER